jgi:predicted transcriptional regulator
MLRLTVLATLLALAAPALAGDPATRAEELVDAAMAIQGDPQSAVSDPQGALDSILTPGEEGGDAGGGLPREGADPGFADRVRAAFRDEMVFAGVATLVAAGLGLAGFALVTRYITPKEALKNPQRSMLYGFIRGNPGVHLKRLSDEFGMKTSSILWHIRKLESAELVRSERANGFRVFYPTAGGMQVRLMSRASTALQNPNAHRLFAALTSRPGASAADLAALSSIPIGTVRWHVRKLKEFGLVEEVMRDGNPLYFGTALGQQALAALDAMPDSLSKPAAAAT